MNLITFVAVSMPHSNTVLTCLRSAIKEIVAVNHGWKLACNLFEQTSSLATSLRDLKTCKQIRLLQAYGTTQVYLAIDPAESPEPLYSVRLRHPIGNRTDAEHIPVRVAQEILSPAELNRLLRTTNFTGDQKCL